MSYKTKLIIFIFFMFVILSAGVVSASHAVDAQALNDTGTDFNQNADLLGAASTDILNDTGSDLKQNAAIAYDCNNITGDSLNLSTAINFNSSSIGALNYNVPNNNSYYHSIELCFVKNLVDNYGNYNIAELASIYDVDTSCISNALQFVRCGVYGADLKNALNHKDYVLNLKIMNLTSCQSNFSKLKNKRGSGFGVCIAEKILDMYGKYSIRQMAYQLEKENITIGESEIQLILYHIKMNDGVSGYGDDLQIFYNEMELYLNQTIPQLQSYIIKTDAISYNNPKTSDYNITFNDVEEYCINSTYTVRVFDNQGKPVTSGYISFFINDNLKYLCAVNEYGLVSFKLNDIIKTMGQYTITCLFSNTIKRDNITIGNITLNDFFKVKTIFEGVKVYNPGDIYKIKFLSTGGKNLTGSDVIFSINNHIIGGDTVDSDGVACFRLYDAVTELLESPNCFIKSELYDEILNDYLPINEYVTIGTRSIPIASKGSLLPKWRDAICEVCDDGYHVYIDENNYQLIESDGSSFIVHVENITSSDQLKNFFKTLSSENVKWDIVIVNLKKATYDVDFVSYSDREWDYALKFPYGQLIIRGNGATFNGHQDINFLNIGIGANVMISQLTLESFSHCFFNYGLLYCSQVEFSKNCAIKTDVLIEGSGSVIHNFNIAEFFACTFRDNDARYFGISANGIENHMGGSILYAEPYSTTYFDRNIYAGRLYDDSIFACKYSSIVIVPGRETEWTYEHFIGESFIHYLASVSIVNQKETICWDHHENNYNPLIFNCSNSTELANALRFINKQGAMGSEVIINLINTTYSFTVNDAKNLDMDYGKGYRGSFISNMFGSKAIYEDYRDNDHKVYANYRQYYFLNVGGFIPITINGNGARIKISNNKLSDDYHFAFIGHNAKLTLNNLTLSQFNTAFINAHGNLLCNACDLSENKIEYDAFDADDGGVLRSFGGSSIFKNCIMKNNRGTDGTDFAYAEDKSYLEIDNCTISQHYPIYATLKDSTIKCSPELYKNHTSATSTVFLDNGPREELVIYVINSTEDLKNISSSGKWAEVTIFEFNCSCTPDLNEITRHFGTIYLKSNGHQVKIISGLRIEKETAVYFDGFTFEKSFITSSGSLSLLNCSLKNCNSKTMITNNGQCLISDCLISNNNCENIFENKGILTINNSNITKNKADDYGIIYNNEGSVVLFNVTFQSNNGIEVYNFRTSNCVIINCTGAAVIFKEPLSAVQLDGIKTGLTVATEAICLGLGFGFGTIMAPCITGAILTGVSGITVGAGFGLLYGAIESSTFHDYSHLWSNVLTFAVTGFESAMFGYALACAKYEAKMQEMKNKLKEKLNSLTTSELRKLDIELRQKYAEQIRQQVNGPNYESLEVREQAHRQARQLAGTHEIELGGKTYEVKISEDVAFELRLDSDGLKDLTKTALEQLKQQTKLNTNSVPEITFSLKGNTVNVVIRMATRTMGWELGTISYT